MDDFVVNDKLKAMSEKTSTSRCLYKSNPDKLNRGLSSLTSAIEYVLSDDYKKAYLESLTKAGVASFNTIFKIEGAVAEAAKTAEHYANEEWFQTILTISDNIRCDFEYHDTRDQELIYYRVDTVLLVSLLSMMAGYYDSMSIADFWLYFNPFLQLLVPGMPSAKHMITAETIRVVFKIAPPDIIEDFYRTYFSGRAIDVQNMKDYFKESPVLAGTEQPRVFAMDGQEVRASYRAGESNRKKKGAQQVSIMDAKAGTVVAFKTVQKKNQEDKAAIEMLSKLAIAVRENIVFMADAINTKVSFIKFLDDNNIPYLLPFKTNCGNKNLKDESDKFFNSNKDTILQLETICDNNHGRNDCMKFYMFPAAKLPEECRKKYPEVKSIVVYEKTSQKVIKKRSSIVDDETVDNKQEQKVTHSVHYYLSVRECDETALKECASAIRCYWKIESHHNTLDTIMMQDRINACDKHHLSLRLNLNKIVYNTLSYIRQEGQNPWNRGGNNRPMTFSHANRLCANDLFFAMRMIVEYFQKSVANIQEKTRIPTVIKATPLD